MYSTAAAGCLGTCRSSHMYTHVSCAYIRDIRVYYVRGRAVSDNRCSNMLQIATHRFALGHVPREGCPTPPRKGSACTYMCPHPCWHVIAGMLASADVHMFATPLCNIESLEGVLLYMVDLKARGPKNDPFWGHFWTPFWRFPPQVTHTRYNALGFRHIITKKAKTTQTPPKVGQKGGPKMTRFWTPPDIGFLPHFYLTPFFQKWDTF